MSSQTKSFVFLRQNIFKRTIGSFLCFHILREGTLFAISRNSQQAAQTFIYEHMKFDMLDVNYVGQIECNKES